MATRYSPRIVTDGLIFLIDPASTRCIQSGDTECSDLIGNSRVTGASGNPGSGTPTVNTSNFPAISSYESDRGQASSVFDFTGGKGMNVHNDLGDSGATTYMVWLRHSGSTTKYLFDARNDGGVWFLTNYDSYNLNWASDLRFNFDGSYAAADFPTTWICVVATGDGTIGGTQLFLNGVQRTLVSPTAADPGLGANLRIGTRYTTGSHYNGLMGPIAIYNKVLTQAEVTQNYLAHKGRYDVWAG